MSTFVNNLVIVSNSLTTPTGNVLTLPDDTDEVVVTNCPQTLHGKVIDATKNTLLNIGDDQIINISTAKIAGGVISDSELSTLSGVTGNIQPQLVAASIRHIIIGFPPFQTNIGAYRMAGTFIYPGSDAFGVTQSIRVIVRTEGNNNFSGKVRIFDVANHQIIAEQTNIVAPTEIIWDMGPLSNIPTGPTVFELQAAKHTGSGTLFLSGAHLFN